MSIGDFLFSARVVNALASGALRSIAAAIARGLSGLGLFNWIRRRWGPLTSTEASQLYGTAQRYVSAGLQQTAMGSQAIINPALVPQVSQYFASFDPSINVQYDVRIGYIDPNSGEQKWLTTYVNSDTWLSNTGVAGEAALLIDQRQLETMFGGQSPGTISPYVNHLNVVGIVQR